MKYLTYIFIAGLMLVLVACDSSEQIAEVSPQDVHTPTSMPETVSVTRTGVPTSAITKA